MLLPKRRLETCIETHPRPLLLEGRAEVPSNKRGFRGVYTVFQKALAGSSLQLEPEGLYISWRCDCSTGYRLFKLRGSGCKPEPAREPSPDGDCGCMTAHAPDRQQELAPTKNIETPVRKRQS